MVLVPSSKKRRRVEITVGHFDRLRQVAAAEGRTVTSVLDELLGAGFRSYVPDWEPSGEPRRFGDRLTPRARRVVESARREAPLRFNHRYSGTEHLLLALAEDPEGVAGGVLRAFGVAPDKVAHAIEYIIGRGDRPPETSAAVYAPRVYTVLALAADEARRLGHPAVGTGHLLLGVVREGEGIAAGILESLEAGADALRAASLRALAGGDVPPDDLASTSSGPE